MALTRLPCGRINETPPPLGEAAWAFPIVGALVGAIAGAVFLLAAATGLPALACALLAIATSVLVTGGLHEDGLADMADGFGGGRDTARKLEIMRDSALGSYGALALVLVIGLTASAMTVATSLWPFIAIGAASRIAMIWPMAALAPARDDGLGAMAKAPVTAPIWVAAVVTVAVSVWVLSIWSVLVGTVTTLAVMILAKRQIGGQTGDVLGAVQKLVECSLWLAFAATVA